MATRFRKCFEHRITLVYASGLMTDVIIADGQRLQETLIADDIHIDVCYFNVRVWSDGEAGKIPLPPYDSLWTLSSNEFWTFSYNVRMDKFAISLKNVSH